MSTIDELTQGMKQAVFEAGVQKAWRNFSDFTDLVAFGEGISPQQLCLLCAVKIIKLMADCKDKEVFEYFLKELLTCIEEGSRKVRKERQP